MYIVFKSWEGAQGQGPTIDLVLCVSVIKVDIGGYGAKLETICIMEHHVKMQFNKIPQRAMDCNMRDGSMISQGIGRGVSQNLDPIG